MYMCHLVRLVVTVLPDVWVLYECAAFVSGLRTVVLCKFYYDVIQNALQFAHRPMAGRCQLEERKQKCNVKIF